LSILNVCGSVQNSVIKIVVFACPQLYILPQQWTCHLHGLKPACVGQTFSAPHTYTYHVRTCPLTKVAFFFYEKATFLRDVLQAKKRRKMEDMIRGEASDSNHRLRRSYRPTRRCQIPETTYGESQDLNRPIAERRVQRQNRQLPKLYRDTCPALCKLFRFLFLFILCRTHL
jgi:hypothetical protein